MKSHFGFRPSVSNFQCHSSVTAELIVVMIVAYYHKSADAANQYYFSRKGHVDEREYPVPKPQIDMCNLRNYTGGKFEIMASGSDILNSGVCLCQLSRLKGNVGFWIALNNFSCPVNACPWRFQIIADGCVKDQYCCSSNWEGQEITIFPHTDKISSVYLQISQLDDPPLDIGTVSVSVRVEGEGQWSDNDAQLTCGINNDVTQNYDFAKCGRMHDLKKESKSRVASKRRDAEETLDLCISKPASDNPVTFGLNVEPTHGDFLCSAKISPVNGTNTYRLTFTKFICTEVCSYRLMVIVQKCIKHYYCCGPRWEEVTKTLDDVHEPSYIRVFKFGKDLEQLTFSLTVLIEDSKGNPLPPVEVFSGYVGDIFMEFCPVESCAKTETDPTSLPAPDSAGESMRIATAVSAVFGILVVMLSQQFHFLFSHEEELNHQHRS